MLKQLQLVVILSCHSEAIGRVFFEAGVKHVICIRQDMTVSDEASTRFANQFYNLLFTSDLTICQIFSKIRNNIENDPDNEISKEAKKFLLFRAADYPYYSEEFLQADQKEQDKQKRKFYERMKTFDWKSCECTGLRPNENLQE